MVTEFNSNDRSVGTDPTRQQFKATLRTTADLDYSGPRSQSDLIEESSRFLGKFLGLLLQASLLNWAVAQKVLVIVWQLSPHHLVEFSIGVSRLPTSRIPHVTGLVAIAIIESGNGSLGGPY